MFLSIHNLGLATSGALSWALMCALGITREDVGNLWLLVVVCGLLSLTPITLLPLVPDSAPQDLREATLPKSSTSA